MSIEIQLDKMTSYAGELENKVEELTALAQHQQGRIAQLTAMLETQYKVTTALADLDEKRRAEIAELREGG